MFTRETGIGISDYDTRDLQSYQVVYLDHAGTLELPENRGHPNVASRKLQNPKEGLSDFPRHNPTI